jgi:hypothetical protein
MEKDEQLLQALLKNDLNTFVDHLKNTTNMTGQKMFNLDQPTHNQANIKPDKAVAISKFKPHPFLLNTYLAHPQTIKAMRKDIWVLGEELYEISLNKKCKSCHEQLDIQFWLHCPFCETAFEN